MKLLSKKLFLSLGLAAFILIQNAPLVFGQNPEDFDYVDPSGRYYTPVPVPDKPVPGDFDYTGPMPDSTPDPSYTPPSSTTKTPPSTTGAPTTDTTRDVYTQTQIVDGLAGGCSWSPSTWYKGCVAYALGLVSFITGILFWISSVFFNVLSYISLDAATWIGKTSPIGEAIQGVWQTLRDLANMFFIFVIIYTGISAMLNLGLVDTRKQIIKVITIAVFINFSLVITRVVIDASNIAAYGFYDAFPNARTVTVSSYNSNPLLTESVAGLNLSPEEKAAKEADLEAQLKAAGMPTTESSGIKTAVINSLNSLPNTPTTPVTLGLKAAKSIGSYFSEPTEPTGQTEESFFFPPGSKNLAGPFMHAAQVTEMEGTKIGKLWNELKIKAQGKDNGWSGVGAAIFALFMLIIMQVIGSFVLFAAGILFMIRTAYLIILMIVSPIAFICYSTPKLEKYWKEWWDKLLHQAFFAPIFLGFFYIAAVIFTASTDNNFFQIENAGGNGFFGLIASVFIQFAMASAFMIIALLSAQSLGARGASTIVNWGNKKRKNIQSRTLGFAGRNTMGRAAHALSETDAMKNFALKHTLLGNFAKKKVGGVANAKYGGTVGYSDALKNYAKERGEMYDYVTKDKYGEPIMVKTGEKDAEGNDIEITAAEAYASQNIKASRSDKGWRSWVRTRSSIEAAKAVQKKHGGEEGKTKRKKDLQNEIEEEIPRKRKRIDADMEEIQNDINTLSRKAASGPLNDAEISKLTDLRNRLRDNENKKEALENRERDLKRKLEEDARQERMAEGIEKTSSKESGGAKPETPKTT